MGEVQGRVKIGSGIFLNEAAVEGENLEKVVACYWGYCFWYCCCRYWV